MRRWRGWLACLLLVLVLGGCTTGSYVAVLPGPDGAAHGVQVAVDGRQTTLDKPHQAVGLARETKLRSFRVSDQRIAQDFSAALAAQPATPLRFQLYFDTGGVELTAASQLSVGEIVEAIRLRGPSAVSVIGHTDTLGGARQNEALGLVRASKVADLLRSREIDVIDLVVASHGERNLLVQTPNWVSEPRNRRVEVIVR